VEAWIEFGRGSLFRLALSLMALGLLRVILLTVTGIAEAYQRNSDRIVPWKAVARQTLGWLAPLGRLWQARPFYGIASFLFHIGLLAVPLFLGAHILLWRRATGYAWPGLPAAWADSLTLLTIAAGLGLFLGRILHRGARALSRLQDYVWPVLLIVPFVTGYLCSHAALRPATYLGLMLVHVYSANLIMVMIPFTKIAHCVLAPFSQAVTAVAWKFVPGAGERVAATLGYDDSPNWVAGARNAAPTAIREKEKEVCPR
jgi:nitrate reductase gamma subunit